MGVREGGRGREEKVGAWLEVAWDHIVRHGERTVTMIAVCSPCSSCTFLRISSFMETWRTYSFVGYLLVLNNPIFLQVVSGRRGQFGFKVFEYLDPNFYKLIHLRP